MATTKQPVVDTETGEVIEEEANEHLSDQYDAAPSVVSEVAWNVGNRLLDACNDELAAAGIHKSSETKYILSRLERRIKLELLEGYRKILAGSSPSVIATLKKVVFQGDKVEGQLVIDKNTSQRHELADFAGSDVLVVLADDVEEHVANMDEMIAELSEMQTELDLGHFPGKVADDAPNLADVDSETGETPLHGTEPDPARILMEDGVAVGLSPDPDCETCGGDGGFDLETEARDGTYGWQKCACTELPGDSS